MNRRNRFDYDEFDRMQINALAYRGYLAEPDPPAAGFREISPRFPIPPLSRITIGRSVVRQSVKLRRDACNFAVETVSGLNKDEVRTRETDERDGEQRDREASFILL